MRSEGVNTLRAALKAFGTKDVVSGLQLAAALGLETESQKQVMRRRLHELVQRGEAECVGHGQYRYKGGQNPANRVKATGACGG